MAVNSFTCLTTTTRQMSWGMRVYASGTTNVEHNRHDTGKCPYLFVSLLDPHPEESDASVAIQTERYRMASDLAAFLNGENAPRWLKNFKRVSETRLESPAGMIEAVGPLHDANPPHLQWEARQDQEAKDSRARLVDLLFGIGNPSTFGDDL